MSFKIFRRIYLTLLVLCALPVIIATVLPSIYPCVPTYGIDCPGAPLWLLTFASLSVLTVFPALILSVIAIIDGFFGIVIRSQRPKP